MKLYNSYSEGKWQRVKTDPYFEGAVENTVALAEKFLKEAPPVLKFSDLHLFVTTGDRRNFETAYFLLKKRVDVFFVSYMLNGNEKYLNALVDEIWHLCNMETWALPAHVKETEPFEVRKNWLELVSCNVGRQLGEIYAAVGDKLPELVARRIKHEVRERIFKGYEARTYGWSHGESNWAAVCIAGVLGSYVYIAEPEEVEAVIPSLMESAECYLRGFDDEGCCKEGYGYWHYGFVHFCIFAELLKNYTGGRIDYFKNPKVHAIAKFQENMSINDHECIRFSDCSGDFAPDVSISHFLKGIYPDVQIPEIPGPTSHLDLTYLCWIEPDFKYSKMEPKSFIFHENQWFIYRSAEYNFVCKAGCNNEPHNHNDVGSFMISKGGSVTFTDPGTGEYTRQYFGPERFTCLEPSARSHSVPIINGKLEEKKPEKSKIYIEKENEYAFSMENAYFLPELTSLKRHFVCEKDGVTLTDTYEFSEEPTSVTERFISLIEPKMERGRVTVANSILTYDPEIFDSELSSEISNRKGGKKEPVYMIDLKVKNPTKNMTVSVKFS